jgi:hypothetical protein
MPIQVGCLAQGPAACRLRVSDENQMCPPSSDIDESEQQYFVVGADGKRQGPMLKYRVIELLERDFVSKMDRVGRDGEALIPLSHHPDFAGYFIQGDSRNLQLESGRELRSKRKRHYRNKERIQGGKRLFFWLGILLSPFFVYRLRFVMFPDPALDWMHARIFGGDETVGGQWAGGNSKGGTGAATRSESGTLAVLVQSLRTQHPGVKVKAALLYEQGWQEIIGGERAGSGQSILKMEQAVVASKGAAWALSGLAAAKSMAGNEQSGGSPSVATLLALLAAQPGAAADASTALAAKALAEGDDSIAYAHADDCIRQSEGAPECQWMAAVAMGRSGRLDGLALLLSSALAAYPNSPELALWKARIALESGQWAAASAGLLGIEEVLGQQPDFLENRALLRLATGDLAGARTDFAGLGRQRIDGRSATLMHSILLYQVEGLNERAADQLTGLAEGDLKGFSQKDLVLLHAAHAARLVGRLDAALAFAKQATEEEGVRVEGWLAQAMALDAAGDVIGAEAAFDQLEGAELKGPEAAKLHAWAAGFYLRRDRLRIAATERLAAESEDPHWAPLVLLGVQEDLRLQDIGGIKDRLARSLVLDLDQNAARLPLVRNFVHLGIPNNLGDQLVTELGQTPAMTADLPWMVGTVRLLQCATEDPCPEAQRQFDRALRQNGMAWEAHAGLARLALRQGEWAAVLKHLVPVIAQKGESAVALAMRGQAQSGLGEHTLAKETLERSVRLDPSGTAGSRALVATLAALGQWGDAQRTAENVWRLEPNDSVTAAVMRTRPMARKKSAE